MSKSKNIKTPNGGFPPIIYCKTAEVNNKLSKERQYINPIKNANIRDIFKVEVENKKLVELNIDVNKDDDVIEVI